MLESIHISLINIDHPNSCMTCCIHIADKKHGEGKKFQTISNKQVKKLDRQQLHKKNA